MYLVYTPTDGDVQRYHLDINKMPNIDAEAIERVTDWTLGQWQEKMQAGSVLANRALLWVLQRRVHPTLKFTAVSFTLDQISAEMEPDELIAARAAALDDDTISEDVRAKKLAAIEEQMDELGLDHDAAHPKAPEKSAASATS